MMHFCVWSKKMKHFTVFVTTTETRNVSKFPAVGLWRFTRGSQVDTTDRQHNHVLLRPVFSRYRPCWGENWQELEESPQEGGRQRGPRAAGHQRCQTRRHYQSKWRGVSASNHQRPVNRLFNPYCLFFFAGKAGFDVRAQLGGGWADEMHQEPDGEPHHRTAAQGDQRHVFGFGSQVNREGERERDGCLWLHLLSEIPPVESQHSSLPLRQRVFPWQQCVGLLFGLNFGLYVSFPSPPSLSRYKLKFSPDKVDTMIVQAICKLCLSDR